MTGALHMACRKGWRLLLVRAYCRRQERERGACQASGTAGVRQVQDVCRSSCPVTGVQILGTATSTPRLQAAHCSAQEHAPTPSLPPQSLLCLSHSRASRPCCRWCLSPSTARPRSATAARSARTARACRVSRRAAALSHQQWCAGCRHSAPATRPSHLPAVDSGRAGSSAADCVQPCHQLSPRALPQPPQPAPWGKLPPHAKPPPQSNSRMNLPRRAPSRPAQMYGSTQRAAPPRCWCSHRACCLGRKRGASSR